MVKTENISKIQSDSLKTTTAAAAAGASASRNKKKYKGVRMRSWGSWVSEIRAPNQKTRIWLGSYSTAEAAARAYDAALLCLKGSSANLNFPPSHSPFIPDTIMSPKSIQRVAAAAAAAAVNTNCDSFDSFENHDNATNGNPSATIVNGGGCAAGTSTTSSTSFSPPLSSTSSSTLSPTSPSPSSSSSNQTDDIDASSTNSSLPYYCPSYTTSATYEGHYAEELMRPSMDPWIDLGDLQSPKYMDHVLNANAMFNMPSIEDFYEGGDLSLWSFC